MFKYSIFYILCINTGECFIKPRVRMQTNLRKPRWKWAGEMYSNKKSIDDNKEDNTEQKSADIEIDYLIYIKMLKGIKWLLQLLQMTVLLLMLWILIIIDILLMYYPLI